MLQPFVGYYTDERPCPYWLPISMLATLLRILALPMETHYGELLAGASMMGVGTSIFYSESSRIARVASGGRHELDATVALTVIIGLILSSAFPAIIVYAQELLPGRTGMVAGLFFSLTFGIVVRNGMVPPRRRSHYVGQPIAYGLRVSDEGEELAGDQHSGYNGKRYVADGIFGFLAEG